MCIVCQCLTKQDISDDGLLWSCSDSTRDEKATASRSGKNERPDPRIADRKSDLTYLLIFRPDEYDGGQDGGSEFDKIVVGVERRRYRVASHQQ